jgi:hypothetical protein
METMVSYFINPLYSKGTHILLRELAFRKHSNILRAPDKPIETWQPAQVNTALAAAV